MTKSKLILITISVFFFSLVAFSSRASAATIFTEDFNSYGDGTLNGTSSWVNTNNVVYVQGTTTYEGAKAIYFILRQAGDYELKRQGTLLNDGASTVYFRSPVTTYYSIVWKYTEGSSAREQARVYNGALQVHTGGVWTSTGLTYDADTWVAFTMEWRSSDHKVRFLKNGANATAWYDVDTAWTSGLDTIVWVSSQEIAAPGNQDAWIDYIAQDIYGGGGGTTTTVAGSLTFPWVLMIILAVFILCFIIDKGGAKIIKLINGAYRYRLK